LYFACSQSNILPNALFKVSLVAFVIYVVIEYMRDEVTGDWRQLHNEGLHNMYSSPNIITMIKSRRMRWAGHVARMEETRNVYRILVGKPDGKRPLGLVGDWT
jgi:hypothetical protein